jgi:hypothetical protein
MLVAWLGSLLAIVALADRTDGFAHSAPLFIAVLLLAAVPIAVARSVVMRFRCPRCKRPFFRKTPWYGNFFTRRCPHCALPKWTDVGVERS